MDARYSFLVVLVDCSSLVFFSSRRRHTRFDCDWSSDVCSSDLAELLHETEQHHGNYEKTHGKHNWWEWYAPYLDARQNGKSPKEAAAAADRYMEDRKSVV